MLDDVANLQLLFDSINKDGFWSGVLGGNSGPSGRPVSLLSFALQQSSWPNDPASFKLVNIIIHIFNSLLMIVITYWLLPHLFEVPEVHRLSIAVAIAGFWALLPIQISTVLYVVQRMVLLSSMFMLLAIVFYLWARSELQRGATIKVFFILLIGVCGSSFLAILSKESGLLVFAFLITIELILQKKHPFFSQFSFHYFLLTSLLMPLILFVAYIIYMDIYDHYDGRTFTLVERILTQPRILLDYVQQIVIPVQSKLGLYHDDYIKSTTLFNPASTIWAIIFWLGFAVLAIWAKFSNKPWVFFAFFWFVSGHLMESTIIPLELYFEHRNYLSSLGILILLIGICVQIYPFIKSKFIRQIALSGAFIYLCLIASITVSHVNLWGNKGEYMVVSAKENPTSLRARMLMIDYYDALGNIEAAKSEIVQISTDFPQEIAIKLSGIHYACENSIESNLVLIDEDDLRKGRFSHATEATLLKIVDLKKEGKCSEITYQYLLFVVDGILNNSRYNHVRERFLKIKGIIYFHLNEYSEAIQILENIQFRDYADESGLIILYMLNNEYDKANSLYLKMEQRLDLTTYQHKKLMALKLEIKKFMKEQDK